METLQYDFVVLGSGIAGLTFALQAAAHGTVAVVCKAGVADTNTAYAQGGIAAVLSALDSFEEHVQDTLEAGAGLCNEAAVRFMVEQAPAAIRWLQEQGVDFDTQDTGIALGLEGGHSQKRIVHVKDHTGRSIQQVLSQAVRRHPNITLLEHHMGIDLLMNSASTCVGVHVLDMLGGAIKQVYALKTVLATGGAGQVYQHTTNPEIATGDGLAMAHRAGASIKGMEFFQFHPTALYQQGEKMFLISEALRGAGAELVLPDGSPFMHRYHALASLAPRDIVARAVLQEMQHYNSPCLYLDATRLPQGHVQQKFPSIYAKCYSIGIDPETEFIPVVPAAHYQCGGVLTDLHGCTSIAQLYAVGEVACTGVHGANRLASNSLLEGVVYATSAARHTQATLHAAILPNKVSTAMEQIRATPLPVPGNLKNNLQKLMWEYAGIVRSEKGLKHCLELIQQWQQRYSATRRQPSQESLMLQNLLTVAELIVEACLKRSESVGGHFLQNNIPPITADYFK